MKNFISIRGKTYLVKMFYLNLLSSLHIARVEERYWLVEFSISTISVLQNQISTIQIIEHHVTNVYKKFARFDERHVQLRCFTQIGQASLVARVEQWIWLL